MSLRLLGAGSSRVKRNQADRAQHSWVPNYFQNCARRGRHPSGGRRPPLPSSCLGSRRLWRAGVSAITGADLNRTEPALLWLAMPCLASPCRKGLDACLRRASVTEGDTGQDRPPTPHLSTRMRWLPTRQGARSREIDSISQQSLDTTNPETNSMKLGGISHTSKSNKELKKISHFEII